MGNQDSKTPIYNTPETPQFYAHANMLLVSEDPRSPGSRTPIIIQDSLFDPRSPETDEVDRTPIFAIPEPVSPFLRFKMENSAYQDSPLTQIAADSCQYKKSDDSIGHKDDPGLSVANASNPNTVCENDDFQSSYNSELAKKTKVKRKLKNSSKKTQSLLRQALFKPLTDENDDILINNEQTDVFTPEKSIIRCGKSTLKQTPLGTRNINIVANENVTGS